MIGVDVGRQGIWRITERGRQRLEKEWPAFEARPRVAETQSEYVSVDQNTHSLVQNQLQEIGTTLGKFATTEFRESVYRYDVVWKDSRVYFPRVYALF